MSPCERILRNAYANPHLRGERSRICRWERAWWTRHNRHLRWNARRRTLMAMGYPHDTLGPVPGWVA